MADSFRPWILLATGMFSLLLILSCGNGAEKNDTGGDLHAHSEHHAGEPHAQDPHHEHDAHAGHMHDQDDRPADMHMSEADLSGTVREGVRVIAMKARRYEFDPSPIVVRSGEEIQLEVTSEDVTHGIEIQGHDIKKKLPPGETVTVRFTAGDSGTYHIHCSEYCGPGHEDMHAELIVRENES